MNCPICDKSFDLEDQLTTHLENHKKHSFLNSNPEQIQNLDEKSSKHGILINKEKFFGKEKFEELISKKLRGIEDLEKLVERRYFAEQVEKIFSKHPFVHLPYFIEDWFNGEDSGKILEKYSIFYHFDLKVISQKNLKLEKNRYRKKKFENAYDLNMKISNWKEKYKIFKNNCKFFENELLELIFLNVLRSFILIVITDYIDSGISKKNIISRSKTLKNNYSIFKFVDSSLAESFEKFYDDSFDNMVQNILNELIHEKILKRKTNDPELLFGRLSIDKIKQKIIKELKLEKESQTESKLRTIVMDEYPSLRLIPGLKMWETSLGELFDEKIIHLESKTNFRNSSMIFLNENYERIQQNLHRLDDSPVVFYGRKISPENFIYELTELEKGDFDDQDDQVTRIAGLVLAESVKLRSIHEIIPEFDFSIDISNYNFRPEQLSAMKKLNFQMNLNIFHCKVMLDEVLDLKKITQLKKVLPENEQGIAITFKKIPENVKRIIENDKSIQIIDEEGLKTWARITPVIPSRKNSIAKLYFDPISKLEKKLVRINVINYVEGLASVSVFPEMKDATVLIRSLEEIHLHEPNPNDFELFSSNYLEFLQILTKLSTYPVLIEGIFDKKIMNSKINHDSKFKLNFQHHEVSLNLESSRKNWILNCDCLKWAENSLYLCPHLASALDYSVRNFSMLNITWNDSNNSIKRSLEKIIHGNISLVLDRLGAFDEQNEMNNKIKIFDFVLGLSKIKESN